MSKFTIESTQHPVFVTLEESLEGQVDIMVTTPDGKPYRIAALGDGKLHLFRINAQIARSMGLKLDTGHFPTIYYCG